MTIDLPETEGVGVEDGVHSGTAGNGEPPRHSGVAASDITHRPRNWIYLVNAVFGRIGNVDQPGRTDREIVDPWVELTY